MLDSYPVGKDAHIPVRLFNGAGAPVVGALQANVTVTILKGDSVTANVSFTGTTSFTEITTGAFANTGTYELIVAGANITVVGPCTFAIKDSVSGATAIASITVMSALPSDVIANVWAAS